MFKIVFIFIITIMITTTYSVDQSKTSKEKLVNNLMKGLKIYTNKIINESISSNPKRLLDILETKLSYINGNRPQLRGHTELIAKGFKILISDNKELSTKRFNVNLLSSKVSKTTYDNANKNRRFKEDVVQEIDDIIKQLSDFARRNSFLLEDAVDIIKNKVRDDFEANLNMKLNLTSRRFISKKNREDCNKSKELLRSTTTIEPLIEITPTFIGTAIESCSPRICQCDKGTPTNIYCNDFCKLTCSHKFQLDNWNCDSVNNTYGINFTLICDGFYDCKDKSDEIDCNYNSDIKMQFEATKIFKDLLQPQPNIIKEKHFYSFRLKLRNLYNRITFISKNNGFNNRIGDTQIVNLRTNLIKELQLIYDGLVKDLTKAEDIEEIFISINEIKLLLIKALKYSQTGNRKAIPEDACLCYKNECAISRCSNDCRSICSKYSQFARYVCKSSDRKEVPMLSVCDGKYDCPRLDDESNCKKEPCRNHHLILLKRQLQEFKQKPKVKEELKFWVTKQLDRLKQKESNNKEIKKIFNDLILESMMNLILEYTKHEESRRDISNSKNRFKSFYEVAKIFIESRRSCAV